MSKSLKVYLQGHSDEIILNDIDFVYQGGEGSIYKKNNTAYKIYIDSAKVISSDKVKELSVLTDPNIIIPTNFVVDSKGKKLGYTMRFIKDTHPLLCLFTRSFKQRNNVSYEQTLNLVKDLQRIVQFVHEKKILIVDLNEMNFLTDKDFKEIYAIDVNSYQTPHYPATAIADQIRDRQNSKFNTGTDWFSFGIISFQMLTGIHPYKGNHPNFSGPKLEQFDARMKANISVFDKQATYPTTVDSFSNIPQLLRDWYKVVFQDGKRLSPPINYEGIAIVITPVARLEKGKYFTINKDFELPNSITKTYVLNDFVIHYCKGFYGISNKVNKYPSITNKALPIVTPKSNKVIFCWSENNQIKAYCENTKVDILTCGSDLFLSDDRLYVKCEDSILEIVPFELNSNIKLLTKNIAKVMPNATQVFDGFVLQNILGHYYATIFPESGKSYQIKLEELDGWKVIDAKYENHVLMAIRAKSGKNDKVVYRFSQDFKEKDSRIIEDDSVINFTVNQSGVVGSICSTDEIEVFSNKINSKTISYKDPAIDSLCALFHSGNSMMFTKGKAIYRFSMNGV